jgi:hypothetical protein
MASGFLPTKFGIILVRDPIGECELCGVPFYSERDTVAHLGTIEHREAAADMVKAEAERKQRLAMIYEHEDPEIQAHMEKVGKRMLAEGRWVVKPSEKAGFS